MLAAVMPVAPAYAVDPPVTFRAKLTASDGAASDFFSDAIAISGDTMVIGSVNDDVGAVIDAGSAYVFTRSGGVWSQQTRLVDPDGAPNDDFGAAVAISGDTIVVGARHDDRGPTADVGAVYVFTRSGGVWSPPAELLASDSAEDDNFGQSVAISGDSIAVGAIGANAGAVLDAGAAYVFTRSGGAWSQQTKLTASDGAANDYFGKALSLSGDTVVVGAYGDDLGAIPEAGSAYVFTRSAGVWSPQTKLTASDGVAGAVFGYGVALSGDTVLLGAPGVASERGAAYAFTRSGGAWSQQVRLVAADGAADDVFGIAVAVLGDVAVVGAQGDDLATTTDAGSAYVFSRSSGVWSLLSKTTASDGAAGDSFGQSVGLSADTVVAGAENTIGGNVQQGSAYVYSLAVPTAISIKTNATTSKIGGVPILSGLVTPSGLVGKNIVVYVKKAGKSYWTYSSNRTVYSRYGIPSWQYKYYFKRGMNKGLYTYKAFVPAWPGYQASTSPTTVSVRVK
jgi:hypothetical protein